ncbi:hypothetical protein HBI56_171770 [Parastagonospora nodorum]|nr:hypothetical protein HBH53_157610 [Parastagonospora nodorum]KAH3959372.1 hypothetical protein HBH52_244410 [Parastagonospora nodorum]KAH4046213.1 hypothetical protein HBH49_187120 [Parastagonospora nodorum]KAH4112545.1 hypothetical protein HBH47_224710 [Parastagonospora nodorum]KAH4161068.1 hypothetical protein HBH43_174930 [Parastagonospora nodorum]
MPYTIHIPAPYQMRTHILQTLHTTTVPRIDIGVAAPVSIAIYNDTKAWGWNVSYTPLSTYGPGKWEAYRAVAHQNGWFNDLWLIWQREHWLRIKAKDKSMRTVEPGLVRGLARWVRHAHGRAEEKPWRKLRLVQRTIEGVQRVRAATYGRRLMRKASEGDLKGGGVEAEVESLTGSLVERLDAFRWGREVEGGVKMMGNEEKTVEDEKQASESQSPFSDKYALSTKEWYE